jgi:hypothetical protein
LVNNIKEKKENMEVIEPNVFYDYFKTLHSPKGKNTYDNNFLEDLKESLKTSTHNVRVDVLDRNVSQKEIIDACKVLKNNTSSGYDSISNQMIKSSIHIMMPTLLKMFNQILQAEIFPKFWSEGFITPLFKSGDRDNPSNYRGITISNCLSKLFTKILNNRLLNFVLENNIIVNNQIGFIPKHRTTDHILVLTTMIDTFKSQKKCLFLCFIDLKKAFDTVFREGLVYKLQKLNISSQFINIIR